MEKIQLVRKEGVKAQNFVHLGKEFPLYLEYGGNPLEDFEERNNVILM